MDGTVSDGPFTSRDPTLKFKVNDDFQKVEKYSHYQDSQGWLEFFFIKHDHYYSYIQLWNDTNHNDCVPSYGFIYVYRMSDEGDLNSMQYWSENHFITWNAAAYLIGR